MAINWWQPGGTFSPKESFGREEYGLLGPEITTPTLLGSGIFGQTGGTGTGGCQFGYHRNRAGNCVPDATTDGCPAGKRKNDAGQCVTIAGACPTGQSRNAAGNCVTIDDGCPTGQRKNAAGVCVSTGDGGCPAGQTKNAAGVCVPKDGTVIDEGCPALWSRDQWGVCRPPEKKDVTTLCGEGEIWSGGKCHPTGQSCPDPTTHWDAFTGRCLPNEQDLTTCRWGRNPHTDQCNPNPNPTLTTADIGTVRTSPTGGILTDTGQGGDYRTSYSPYGAEDRGQDERSRILAGILDGGTTPYSPILSPAQELAAANRQAAIDFETAPGLLAAIEKQKADAADISISAVDQANIRRASESAAAAEDAQRVADEAQREADRSGSRDMQEKADKAEEKASQARIQRKEDDKRAAAAERQVAKAAAASRASQKAAKAADRQAAVRQRAALDAQSKKAMKEHQEWMATQTKRLKKEAVTRRKYTGGVGGGLLYT